MKRTNLVIDEKLLEAGLKATGFKTRRSLIDYALRDLLRRESQKKILQSNYHHQRWWLVLISPERYHVL